MSEQISSLDKPITLADWHEIYQRLLPYLGGNKAVDGNPIGTVIAFPVSTPPAGYLVCDGSKLSATAFPLLFDVLKTAPTSQRAEWGDADWVTEFNVPDYRGEFIRFYGTNSHANQGSGGAVGEHQDATEHPQIGINTTTTKTTWIDTTGVTPGTNGIMSRKQDSRIYASGGSNKGRSAVNNSISTEWVGATDIANYTSRPTNTSFLPCIKYTYVTQEVEYSPEERVIGVWKETVDGVLKKKPLYEKTVITPSLSVTKGTSSYAVIAQSATELELKECKGTFVRDGISWIIDNIVYNDAGTSWSICSSSNQTSSGTIRVRFQQNVSNDSITLTNIQTTIRYTKTTDEWQTS